MNIIAKGIHSAGLQKQIVNQKNLLNLILKEEMLMAGLKKYLKGE